MGTIKREITAAKPLPPDEPTLGIPCGQFVAVHVQIVHVDVAVTKSRQCRGLLVHDQRLLVTRETQGVVL